MPLTVAVQMDPIARIRIAGDSTFALLLEAQARGHRLLHYTPDRLRLNGSRVETIAEPLTVKDVEGDHARLGEPRPRRPGDRRCRASPPGPAVRFILHNDDASARAHSPEDAGRQRSAQRPRRAGKAVRHGLSRADAADPDRPRPGRDRGVPSRARRGGDEAALWLRRRGGVQDRQAGPELRLAVRSLHCDAARALGDPEIPAGGVARRQAHHSGRRGSEGRRQPRAVGRRHPLQHGARRSGGGDGADRPRARDLRKDRAGTRAARAPFRRDRRDRRLSHRDQRHLADRHPGDQAARRPRSRGRDLGCDRGQTKQGHRQSRRRDALRTGAEGEYSRNVCRQRRRRRTRPPVRARRGVRRQGVRSGETAQGSLGAARAPARRRRGLPTRGHADAAGRPGRGPRRGAQGARSGRDGQGLRRDAERPDGRPAARRTRRRRALARSAPGANGFADDRCGRRIRARHARAGVRHRSSVPAAGQADAGRAEDRRIAALCALGPQTEGRPRDPHRRGVPEAGARRHDDPHDADRGAAHHRRQGAVRDPGSAIRQGDRRQDRARVRRRQARRTRGTGQAGGRVALSGRAQCERGQRRLARSEHVVLDLEIRLSRP